MQLAVIGDIHGFWDAADTAYFNASHYDGLLFVGDLPRLTGGLDVAHELAALTKPACMIPGNHDGCTIPQLLGEIKGWRGLCRLGAVGMGRRVAKLKAALGPVRLAGYQQLQLQDGISLVVARPHAMGPGRFYYRDYMRRAFGVESFQQSADKLKDLVDQAGERLIFLAHNGPAGLGEAASDIWGCDFSDAFGDFGDPDLQAAVEHARASGREVLAVLGGHMHLRSKSGGRRQSAVRRDGMLYINAAEVARIRKQGARRHHVALDIDGTRIAAETVWVDAKGGTVERHPLPAEPA